MKRSLFLLLFLPLAPVLRADVLTSADDIVQRHLPYIYGAEDLSRGGLDCSGFVQVVFHQARGVELPNEADKQLDYLREHGQVWDANSAWNPTMLQPGDLIFFAGPKALPRESQICHVMMYCGNNIMAGAQGEGHQTDGLRAGVGYYRFRPRAPLGIMGESGERFLGHRSVFAYGRLSGSSDAVSVREIGQPISAEILASPAVLPPSSSARAPTDLIPDRLYDLLPPLGGSSRYD